MVHIAAAIMRVDYYNNVYTYLQITINITKFGGVLGLCGMIIGGRPKRLLPPPPIIILITPNHQTYRTHYHWNLTNNNNNNNNLNNLHNSVTMTKTKTLWLCCLKTNTTTNRNYESWKLSTHRSRCPIITLRMVSTSTAHFREMPIHHYLHRYIAYLVIAVQHFTRSV